MGQNVIFFDAVNMFVLSQAPITVAENVGTGNVQICVNLNLPNPPSTVAMSVTVTTTDINACEYLNMSIYYCIKRIVFLMHDPKNHDCLITFHSHWRGIQFTSDNNTVIPCK